MGGASSALQHSLGPAQHAAAPPGLPTEARVAGNARGQPGAGPCQHQRLAPPASWDAKPVL
eukprot:9439916-Lingulodinium_polyedra.AAC.1